MTPSPTVPHSSLHFFGSGLTSRVSTNPTASIAASTSSGVSYTWTLLAPAAKPDFARFDNSVIITGPATAAALQAVKVAPWIAPTFSGPKISARNAGIVANPPPYIVNTTNRLERKTAQLPLAARRGISRNRQN